MIGSALVPRFAWLARYGGHRLVKDIIAGLILAILLVPQAMAYAQLAGLPPEMGLFAAIAPPLLYLLFGTSAFVSLGPVALVSLIVAEAAAGSGIEDTVAAAVIIAIEAGAMLVVLGTLRLGRLVNFISEPVLLGFTAAAAFLIAASQLPTLLGIDTERAGNLVDALGGLLPRLDETNQQAALVGGGVVLVLLVLGKFAAPALWKLGVRPPYRQAIAKSLPLLVMVGAAIIVAQMGEAVNTVAAIDAGLPTPALPPLDPQAWLGLLPSSLAVAIIIFVGATAVAKSLAGEDRSHLNTSREAVALGSGNIAAALFGGYAVGASLSRSALVKDSGAATPIASVIASLVVIATLLFLAPLLAYLPRTALAALVISAVFGLINLREIRNIWDHDRLEGVIIALSFAATLVLGVRLGLAAGAVLGLAHFLWFTSVPRVTRVGTDDDGESFRSVERADVEPASSRVMVVRVDMSIYFANAAYCEDEIVSRVAEEDGLECVVLDMRAVNGIDASGAAMLRRLTQRLHSDGVTTRFAAVHRPVSQALARLDSTICHFHRTVRQALEACSD